MSSNVTRERFIRTAVLSLSLASLTCAMTTAPASAEQASFTSPQAAVDALVESLRSYDKNAVVRVLGPDGRDLISSGDAVADTSARERFISAYDEWHEIRRLGDGPTILYLGPDDFPFPLPLVEAVGRWRFDTAAGVEEVLDRRIGANELAVIEVLKAYVDAQREYAETDRDGKGAQYARRILSQDGKRDGLYWPTNDGEPESPFGPLVAEARSEGYTPGKAARAPYHGYLFRILTAQGKDADGGARDYVVGGRMIGGFALIATPASYGNSGVKSFMVSQDGKVFEKDLGEETRRVSERIASFDPGEGWEPVGQH